jgi:hypothetical protein
MFEQIPVHVLEKYAGNWIVWDQDAKTVVGAAATLDEAEDQAEQVKTDHLLRIHHALSPDAEISGML